MRVLIVSQVYVPDPAAVGQHMASAAEALQERGAEVVVLTADRGYDDPNVRYARRETRGGVDVRRLPFSSLGKRSLPVRLAGMLSFLGQAGVRALFMRRVDALLVSTSPPMAGVLITLVGWLRRIPVAFWAMDLNPEQAVALGKARAGGLAARAFVLSNRFLQKHAARVVVLDRFMAAKLEARGPHRPPTLVIPPWPLEGDRIGAGDGAGFRRQHGLEGKFVVMHSGNHSLAHPLATVLAAAKRLEGDSRLSFVFVGGGVGKREVEAAVRAGANNIVALPYQPLEVLGEVLAAADVHLVAMGDAMVGCVHPCKVYGALAAGRPILYLGPAESHVGEITARGAGWRIQHGDTDGAVATLREIAARPAEELRTMGERNRAAVETEFNAERLRSEFCAFVESMVGEGSGGPKAET
jgi:glycosyltransferase involved in cell wall biosynthesis